MCLHLFFRNLSGCFLFRCHRESHKLQSEKDGQCKEMLVPHCTDNYILKSNYPWTFVHYCRTREAGDARRRKRNSNEFQFQSSYNRKSEESNTWYNFFGHLDRFPFQNRSNRHNDEDGKWKETENSKFENRIRFDVLRFTTRAGERLICAVLWLAQLRLNPYQIETRQ